MVKKKNNINILFPESSMIMEVLRGMAKILDAIIPKFAVAIYCGLTGP
ncbi:MAG: hypothetical protein JRI87_02025 [Deltaproteobacteria bacterium]|nr:hypothetical protein [Deltaproteobacteria bacterium]